MPFRTFDDIEAGDMIALEHFTEADFDRLISWVESEEYLVQFAGSLFKFPLTHEQLCDYLDQKKKVPYRIRLAETGQIIGHCELNFENDIPRLSRILIGESTLRNKGIGRLVLKAMADIIFGTTDHTEIDLSVFDWNKNAIACYEKAGFVTRPEILSSVTISGKKWHAINMILLKSHYSDPGMVPAI